MKANPEGMDLTDLMQVQPVRPVVRSLSQGDFLSLEHQEEQVETVIMANPVVAVADQAVPAPLPALVVVAVVVVAVAARVEPEAMPEVLLLVFIFSIMEQMEISLHLC